jgi:DNA-binding transcriptional ArsR family regulator/predicted nucleotidyltransferase
MGRSSVRRRILAVLAQPETRLHLREIQRRAGTSPGTASRELGRLVAAGLIEREAEGHQVYFRGASTPLAKMLRSLLSGPVAPGFDAPAPPANAAARTAPIAVSATAVLAEFADPSPTPIIAALPDVAPTAAEGSPDELGLSTAARLADRIRPAYGKRLRGVFLYGARARGEAPPDSNVDVLLVLDRVDRYGDELEQTSSACADLSLELGLVVSRIFVSERVWLTRSNGQLPAIRREAVSV